MAATTTTEDLHDSRLISLRFSQPALYQEGPSACTAICLKTALSLLSALSSDTPFDGVELKDVLLEGLFGGMTMNETVKETMPEAAEHATVSHVMQLPELATGLRIVNELSECPQLADLEAVNETTTVLMGLASRARDGSRYTAVVLTRREPEAVLLLLPPDDASSDASVHADAAAASAQAQATTATCSPAPFFLFDPLSRPSMGMQGPYLFSTGTIQALLKRLRAVWPHDGYNLTYLQLND